jgi:hypothetical protein
VPRVPQLDHHPAGGGQRGIARFAQRGRTTLTHCITKTAGAYKAALQNTVRLSEWSAGLIDQGAAACVYPRQEGPTVIALTRQSVPAIQEPALPSPPRA